MVTFSCEKLKPGVACLLNPPSVALDVGGSATSKVVLDWDAGPNGNHDIKVRASHGGFGTTNSLFFTKVDPNDPAPEPRTFTADDYADEPHIKFACNPPPSALTTLDRSQIVTITCTVGSYKGSSDPVLVKCLSYLSCTGSTTVTHPPNGSVNVVLTLSVPPTYQPPTQEDTNVALIAFHNTVFSDPGRLDYLLVIPRLP